MKGATMAMTTEQEAVETPKAEDWLDGTTCRDCASRDPNLTRKAIDELLATYIGAADEAMQDEKNPQVLAFLRGRRGGFADLRELIGTRKAPRGGKR